MLYRVIVVAQWLFKKKMADLCYPEWLVGELAVPRKISLAFILEYHSSAHGSTKYFNSRFSTINKTDKWTFVQWNNLLTCNCIDFSGIKRQNDTIFLYFIFLLYLWTITHRNLISPIDPYSKYSLLTTRIIE